MTKQELEQQKIIFTKQYEEVQKKIDYYGLDKFSENSSAFKELIVNRDNIKRKIEDLKKQIEIEEQKSILSM